MSLFNWLFKKNATPKDPEFTYELGSDRCSIPGSIQVSLCVWTKDKQDIAASEYACVEIEGNPDYLKTIKDWAESRREPLFETARAWVKQKAELDTLAKEITGAN